MAACAATRSGSAAASAEDRLTLADAVARAASFAASARIARLETLRADKDVARERASLFPDVRLVALASDRTYDVAPLGFSLPGAAENLVGPVRETDARLFAEQALVDLSSLWKVRAAREAADASRANAASSASDAAYRAAVAYVAAARARATLDAQRADLDLAVQLLDLAQRQLAAGTAARIDVTRAMTREAEARGLVAIAENEFERARIDLARALGLPSDSTFALADTLSGDLISPVPDDESAAVAFALDHREDLRAARALARAAETRRAAARAERLPRLVASADYGFDGTKPSDAIATRTVALRVSWPLWNGLERESRIQQESLICEEMDVRAHDLELQIAADIRSAWTTVVSGRHQEDIASERLSLADAELAQARERFANGVASNIEVLEAQSSLNRSREALIGARAAVAASRLELARAAGVAQAVGSP
jgi:outer membrane protein TolC